MRSTGLQHGRNEQQHDERFITYEPDEAVRTNPAASYAPVSAREPSGCFRPGR